MLRFKSLAILFIAVGLSFIQIKASAAEIHDSQTLYAQMVDAINQWLAHQPKHEFPTPEQQEVFMWRVQIERLSYEREARFAFFQKLMNELGNKSFTFKDTIYNPVSIKSMLLANYPTYFSRPNPDIPPAVDFFDEAFGWYKEYVHTRQEQMYWLQQFLSFLSGLRNQDAQQVALTHTESIDEIVGQYLAITAIYADQDLRSEIINIDHVYSTQSIWASTGSTEFYLLSPLVRFSKSKVGSLLSPTTKERIVTFVLSRYPYSDEAIEVFAALGPHGF